MIENITFSGIQMEWDEFSWRGILDIPLFGEIRPADDGVEISVGTRDEEQIEPCKEQIDAWSSFVENQEAICKKTLVRVLSYYIEMRPQYESMGPEFVEYMPVLTEAQPLAGMIRLSGISIRWPYENETVRIGVVFGCDWEMEHGLGLVYQLNDIVDIGMADCAC